MKIVVDGIMSEYWRAGKAGAPVVLFLPGWLSSASNFTGMMKKLEDDFDVISIDFPGWPKAEQPPHGWNISNYTDWIVKFLEKVGLNSSQKIYAIIGHSFGGRVILKGLSSGKLKAEKAIFIDSAGVKPAVSMQGKLLKSVAKLSHFLPTNLQQKISQTFASQDYKNLKNNPVMRETFKKVIDEDLTGLMSQISAKTLLIWGAEDQDTPPADARVFANNIPDSKLEIIANAGHYAFLDQPEQVSKLVRTFLR